MQGSYLESAQEYLRIAAQMRPPTQQGYQLSAVKAFWGYLSDKLGIPVADLNRESAVTALKNKNVDENVIDDFLAVIDQSEFARFAPSGGSETRSELYNKAEATMSRLEKLIKR